MDNPKGEVEVEGRVAKRPQATAPRHVATQVVEEHGQVYLPGQELPRAGDGTPRRHELLAADLVVDANTKEA